MILPLSEEKRPPLIARMLSCSMRRTLLSKVYTNRYDHRCDLFSAGVLLYVLLCLYEPFNGEEDKDTVSNVMRGKFTFPKEEWAGISEEAQDLLKRLMNKWPRKRPAAEEALQHPWFARVAQQASGAPMAEGGADMGAEAPSQQANPLVS